MKFTKSVTFSVFITFAITVMWKRNNGYLANNTTDLATQMCFHSSENGNLSMIQHNVTRVFYNMVPKTGSQVVRMVIIKLAEVRGFRFTRAPGRPDLPQQNGHIIDEQDLKTRILKPFTPRIPGKPTLLWGHINFIDFPRTAGLPMPVYINTVREPIARLFSWYTFRRFVSNRTKDPLPDAEIYRSFDDCVMQNYEECTSVERIATIVPYFCGQHAFCTLGNYDSLNQAKRNVIRYYSVVGYMENLAGFFSVLDHKLPDFFTNARRIYDTLQTDDYAHLVQNKTHKPRESTVEELKRRIPHEYEFYNFVKQRFNCQLRMIQDKNKNLNNAKTLYDLIA